MADWLSPAFVAAHADVKGTPPSTSAGSPLVNVCDAAAAYVERVRDDLPWARLGFGWSVPADVRLGSAMLAWRLFQRRAAPLGVTTSPTGDPVEILRNDPDIARLLGVEGSGRFVFGAPSITPPAAPQQSSGVDGIGFAPDGTPYILGGAGVALAPDGTPYLTGGS